MSESEMQQPEKPKKKKSGLSMPVIIGIIAGLALVLIIGVVLLMKFMFIDPLKGQLESGGQEKISEEEMKKRAAEKLEEEFAKLVEEGLTEGVEEKFMQTGRIITNPKGSTQFVVLDLALFYKFKKLEGEAAGGEKKEGEGAAAAESPEEKMMKISIQDVVSSTLGSFSVPELQEKRDSLKTIFLEKLKPVFKKDKKILSEVKISEFIIQ